MDSLVLLAALGSGLVAGTFFVFSVAIMPALGRLSAAEGARAMQSINLVIINAAFLGVFLGTAVLAAAVIIITFFRFGHIETPYLLIASTVYLTGSLFVTLFFNVPLNDRLAAARPETPEGQAVWLAYLRTWTYWNHVRTFASFSSTALFTFGYASIR